MVVFPSLRNTTPVSFVVCVCNFLEPGEGRQLARYLRRWQEGQEDQVEGQGWWLEKKAVVILQR